MYRKKRYPVRTVLISVIVVILCVMGMVFIWQAGRKQTLPGHIIASSPVTVYYPTSMPDGFTLDKPSVNIEGGMLFYTLANQPEGQKIMITLQALPDNLELKTFIGERPVPAVSTPIGVSYDFSTGQRSQFVMTTNDGVLITLNTEPKVETAIIQTLLNSLETVR